MRALLIAVTAFLAGFFPAARADGFDEKAEAALLKQFATEESDLTTRIAKLPDAVGLYAQRGHVRLFLGRFDDAIADYEKMIALDPAQDAPNWQLGIAYYFAGKFAKSARQFEKYHAYDGRDRENGVWKFLAQAKFEPIEKAQREMLVYTRFDREPFPALYEMFAGKKTVDDVFAEMKTKGVADQPSVAFFANYYGGLQYDLLGQRDKAGELVQRAVNGTWTPDQGATQSFMWQVARVHLGQIRKQNAVP